MLKHIGLRGLVFLLLLAALPFTVAYIAYKRDRSPVLWFFTSLCLGGIGGLIILVALEDVPVESAVS
ncbi:MAG: hypothetical protein AAF922_20170 [Pseudomonadota bacterium]